MANPTQGVQAYTTKFGDNKIQRPLASTAQTYYTMEAIGMNSSGYATKMDDTASLTFAGFNSETNRIVVASGGSAGDYTVLCEMPWTFSAYIASAAVADIGKKVYWLYSNEVAYSGVTYWNYAGRVIRRLSATQVEVAPPWFPFYSISNEAGEVSIDFMYDANSVDRCFFIANRNYRVKGIIGRPDVAGTDGSAVTAIVKKAASATAITSGTALHSSTFNVKGTAATNQSLTLSTTAADLEIASGTAIGVDFTGTLTSAVGVITMLLLPVN